MLLDHSDVLSIQFGRREHLTDQFAYLARMWREYRSNPPAESASLVRPKEFDSLTRGGGDRTRRILADVSGGLTLSQSIRRRHPKLIRWAGVSRRHRGSNRLAVASCPARYATSTVISVLVELIVASTAGLAFLRPPLRNRWGQRMTDYRAIAEGPRHQRFLYLLGAVGRVGPTASSWDQQDSWVA